MIQAYGKNIIVKPVQTESNKSILLRIKENYVNWEVVSVGRKVEEVNKGGIIFISPYGVAALEGEEGLFVTQEEHVLGQPLT